MVKAYVSIMSGFTDVDTFTTAETGNREEVSRKIEGILAHYDMDMEFSYTLYDKPHGLSVPVFSRRGMIRDIIADIAGEKV
jgi:hypothetical protein